MNENIQITWKDYVFSWPVYIVMGVALAALVDQTQVIQPLIDKVFKKENK